MHKLFRFLLLSACLSNLLQLSISQDAEESNIQLTMLSSSPMYFSETVVRHCHVCLGQRVQDAVQYFVSGVKEEFHGVDVAALSAQVFAHICPPDAHPALLCDSGPPRQTIHNAFISSDLGIPFNEGSFPLKNGYTPRVQAACVCAHSHVYSGRLCSQKDVDNLTNVFKLHYPGHEATKKTKSKPKTSSNAAPKSNPDTMLKDTSTMHLGSDGPERASSDQDQSGNHLLPHIIEMFDSTNNYEVLGLSKTGIDPATHKPYDSGDIKKAYRSLARQYHPDKNIHHRELATQITSKINHACDTLLRDGPTKSDDAETFTTHFQQNGFQFTATTTGSGSSFSFSFSF